MEDYYKIFGINRFAALPEIKQARNRLAREFDPSQIIAVINKNRDQLGPDVADALNSHRKMVEEKAAMIHEIYRVLSNPQTRFAYDQEHFPYIIPDPTSIDFGAVCQGEKFRQTVVFSNVGKEFTGVGQIGLDRLTEWLEIVATSREGQAYCPSTQTVRFTFPLVINLVVYGIVDPGEYATNLIVIAGDQRVTVPVKTVIKLAPKLVSSRRELNFGEMSRNTRRRIVFQVDNLGGMPKRFSARWKYGDQPEPQLDTRLVNGNPFPMIVYVTLEAGDFPGEYHDALEIWGDRTCIEIPVKYVVTQQ